MATYKYTFNQVALQDVLSVDTYTDLDENLIDSFKVNSSFNQTENYAELHYYSLDGQVLNTIPNHNNFTSPQDSNSANGGTLDSVNLKLEEDLLAGGYDFGDVYLLYNFLNDPFSSNSTTSDFFIEEISPDRYEIRLLSKNLNNEEVLKYAQEFKTKLQNSDFSEFKLNLGNNRLLLATNIDTLPYKGFTSVVIRLYNQLPDDIGIKTTLSIAEEVSDPLAYSVTTEIIPDEITVPYLKGPNFTAGEQLLRNTPTKYFNIDELFSYPVNNSYYEVRSLFNEKGAQLTIDHEDYSNFIHFSSAEERLANFKYKLDLITLYQSQSDARTDAANYPNLTASLDAFSGSGDFYKERIDSIINNFDHYDRFLYYESSSYSWPKQGDSKPYTPLTGSVTGSWYDAQTISASNYDSSNPHLLIYTIPEFLREDPNNSRYKTFVHLVAQHFDNLWLYTKSVTDKYDADNRLNAGLSKDLIQDALENFGIRLYNSNKTTQELFTMFTGDTFSTGSESYVDTLITGSDEIISEEDYRKQIYKRLYHNLPFLLKSKGTERGLRALLSVFGIPSLYSSGSHSSLLINQYGGGLSGSYNLGNYNYTTSSLGKVRIDNTGSLISTGSYTQGNSLSRFVSIEKRDKKYTNDLNIVEAGFSPASYLNRFIIHSASIDNFDVDSILGDPRLMYSSSYNGLASKAKEYLAPVRDLAEANSGNFYDLKDFIRVLKYYDNTLFKMVKDFLPARSNISSGVIIKPHLLERSKTKQVRPSSERHNEFTSSINIGTYSGSHSDVFGSRDQYKSSYSASIMTSGGLANSDSYLHEEPKYNGEFSGSYVKLTDGELNKGNVYKKVNSIASLFYGGIIRFDDIAPTLTPTPTPTVTATSTPTPTPTPTPTNTPSAQLGTFTLNPSYNLSFNGVSSNNGSVPTTFTFPSSGIQIATMVSGYNANTVYTLTIASYNGQSNLVVQAYWNGTLVGTSSTINGNGDYTITVSEASGITTFDDVEFQINYQ